jgi:NitT/TauT family transport system permease protein
MAREQWKKLITYLKDNIFIVNIFSLVLFLLLWFFVTSQEYVNKLFLPEPQQIILVLIDMLKSRELLHNIYVSLIRVALGFAIGAGMAIPLGLLMGWYRIFQGFVDPIIEFFRPIPPLAFIPLAILWFGIGEESKIFVIWLGTFFPILINVIAGIREVDPVLIKAAYTLGAKDRHIFFEVCLPASLPFILAGLRIGLATGWTCLVAAELIAARAGLGFMIADARRYFRTDIVMLGIVVIGVIGILLDRILRIIETKLTDWQERYAD